MEEGCRSSSLLLVSALPESATAGDLEGALLCTKCGAKLGRWAWRGLACECGTHVAPAFAFARKKSRLDGTAVRCLGCGAAWGAGAEAATLEEAPPHLPGEGGVRKPNRRVQPK